MKASAKGGKSRQGVWQTRAKILRTKKRYNIALFGFVLAVAGLFVTFYLAFSVHGLHREELASLEQLAQTVSLQVAAQQASNESLVNTVKQEGVQVSTERFMQALQKGILEPLHGIQGIRLFILGQKDEILLDQHDPKTFDEAQWAMCRTKFSYEMKKLKKGWIYYPEKSLFAFGRSQNVICYSPIPQTEWILGVERTLSTTGQLLARSLDVKFYGLLMMLVCGCFFWMRFMLNRLFSKVQSLSTERGGSGWELYREGINLASETSKALSPASVLSLSDESKRNVMIDPPSCTEPIVNRFHLVREGFMKRLKGAEQSPAARAPLKVTEPPTVNAQPHLYREYAIDGSTVKSDLLKKMIERIRE